MLFRFALRCWEFGGAFVVDGAACVYLRPFTAVLKLNGYTVQSDLCVFYFNPSTILSSPNKQTSSNKHPTDARSLDFIELALFLARQG